ncbi:uncharacterized protein MYCGRDRAFT_110944 [Zymoseptoria tritici IPO323]|uniref:Uncharacterized protein n=1 Tax=Zymoseptoria tritici (strain CBS 115943 / IPO323) TaxID=336722 RepID=F9XL09_ZYMTI|nr:uncharacterized protein MYCGRDRAFT_110944 [Zymoseptoria tritici IPO323]EGP83748.1 hypothetical protein MYCGRDRAFT_110944 [Zymoseptoria tritici IPO323]
MPAIMEEEESSTAPAVLPFPPVTKSHIMHCSFHSWHPKYRTITPKARLIRLTKPFLDYLRADGIILPSDDAENDESDSGFYSASDAQEEDDSDDDDVDIAADWREVHETIQSTIEELGGKVVPKLNWSAPKDATWMNANTMECRTPNDVYLLLKSSDFVTWDLEHAFDDCVESPDSELSQDDIPFHLVLRKSVPTFNPSVEFRCFVRERKLLCICQRDLNHYDFLEKMQGQLQSMIKEFFDVRLRDSFPDESFVFDVYIPQPFNRVWLVDVNPWAPRTDPILFSWLELLDMQAPQEPEFSDASHDFVRLSIAGTDQTAATPTGDAGSHSDSDSDEDEDADEELWLPELRLVRKSDPEAYNFSTQQYSAHKLPKDVVDASQSDNDTSLEENNLIVRRSISPSKQHNTDQVMESEAFWTIETINDARSRWITLQTRSNWTFRVLCPVLTVLALAASRVLSEPIPIWSMSLIWASWWFADAALEVLAHTGWSVRLPGVQEPTCVVPKILPNTAHLSVLVEGHEKTWPRERDVIVAWWRKGLRGCGWEAAPDSRWFSGVLVGVVYLTAMAVMFSSSR